MMGEQGTVECDLCGSTFSNKYQLGPHRRQCKGRNFVDDSESFSASSCSDSAYDGEDGLEDEQHGVPLVTEPFGIIDVRQLARRSPKKFGRTIDSTCTRRNIAVNQLATADYTEMQLAWQRYVRSAHQSCSREFWQVFNTVMCQPATVGDAVLTVVKKLLSSHSVHPNRKWPSSFRGLCKRVQRLAGNFWDHVVITRTINMENFNIRTCKSVKFTFVDPIWVWIQRCDALSKLHHKLHWVPKRNIKEDTGMSICHTYVSICHTCVANFEKLP